MCGDHSYSNHHNRLNSAVAVIFFFSDNGVNFTMVIKHLESLEPDFGVNPSFLALVNILILSPVNPRLMAAELACVTNPPKRAD